MVRLELHIKVKQKRTLLLIAGAGFRFCFGIGFAMLFAHSVFAAEDARVLPQGRSRLSVIFAQTAPSTETFNRDGNPESITEAYHLSLNSQTLAKISPQFQELVQILNNSGWHYNSAAHFSDSHGLTRDNSFPALGSALSRGFLSIDAQATRQQSGIAYQYGVTDRLSAGFLIPVVRTQVQLHHSLTGLNSASDVYSAFVSGSGVSFSPEAVTALNFIRSADIETLQTILTSKGYAPIGDTDVTSLGDVLLGGRVRLNAENPLNPSPWIHSLQAGLLLPTGRLKPPTELTQVDAGSGSTDLALAEISNFKPTSWLLFATGLHYTYRLPGHRTLRVNKTPDTLLADADDEENVAQKLGDKTWITLGAQIQPSDAWIFGLDYEWDWKKADRFTGVRAGRDYTFLSLNTESSSESLQLGASWSSIAAFLKQQALLPLQIALTLNLPLRGRNSVITPYGLAELALYF